MVLSGISPIEAKPRPVEIRNACRLVLLLGFSSTATDPRCRRDACFWQNSGPLYSDRMTATGDLT